MSWCLTAGAVAPLAVMACAKASTSLTDLGGLGTDIGCVCVYVCAVCVCVCVRVCRCGCVCVCVCAWV